MDWTAHIHYFTTISFTAVPLPPAPSSKLFPCYNYHFSPSVPTKSHSFNTNSLIYHYYYLSHYNRLIHTNLHGFTHICFYILSPPSIFIHRCASLTHFFNPFPSHTNSSTQLSSIGDQYLQQYLYHLWEVYLASFGLKLPFFYFAIDNASLFVLHCPDVSKVEVSIGTATYNSHDLLLHLTQLPQVQ